MTLESSMAKLYASEIAVKAADDCVQIHGGYGFVKDYPAEKFFRDVKLTTIGEGTSEIQRLVIARQLLVVTPTLAERVLAGRARGPSRAPSRSSKTKIPAGADLIRALFAHTGRAFLIGVTGPPGAGKSTLVDRLSGRASSRRIARSASSRSIRRSPFTGGAVLGDRLRMQSHVGDEGVFIRSMATRGHLGGLARATADAALVLDAAGRDIVIIETVGVGQDEVDIVRTADVSVVTLVPGTGDDVQALKAGIMEIADIFVVNKADRDGADRLVSAVESNLSLHAYGAGDWRPPIVKTVATTGEGVPELMEAIARFREHAKDAERPRRRARAESRLREIVSGRLMAHLEQRVLAPGELAAMVDRVAARELDPYTAADQLVRRSLRFGTPESRSTKRTRSPLY